MTFDELKEKARSLPLAPGVYLMQDKGGKVIYVGKAKKLRNRVSQYFQDSAAHSPKTRRMVSMIDHFDVIVAASEFEALVLECSLIKRHMPKYNILLKDDKGYPYLRIDMRDEYPVMTMVNRVMDDGADYYGPYGGRFVTQQLIDTIRLTFKLPGCGKSFPKDLGKDRPCLNYHMNNCDAWCQLSRTAEEYRLIMKQVTMLLQGKYKQIAQSLRQQMEDAAEALEFERAAALRDRMLAIENLGKKQLVTAGTMAHTDVIGYYEGSAKACFSVLHFVDGSLLDKSYEIVPLSGNMEDAVSSLVKQYYLSRNCAPKEILLPCEMEDAQLFSDLLYQNLKKRVHIRVPQRGDGVRLVQLANKNASEEAERVTSKEERTSGTLLLLRNILGLQEIPSRMEAYDISNTAGTDIVASMVVFVDGKPLKRDYKRFKIHDL
ncbi:MAG: excinuclease ABC subunit UvrC, partial [Oscillospiraceae bacterium]|nr:excinuclease ABC subunit UvrC [Oscillospiraceae bacterium]